MIPDKMSLFISFLFAHTLWYVKPWKMTKQNLGKAGGLAVS